MKNKTWQKWTPAEDELLKYHWKNSTMDILLNHFPNRNYNSLMTRAVVTGVKSEIRRNRKGSLDYLNVLNCNSCYWWGFIIADGHITHKGELIITLNKKDENHLSKLANHLNCKISKKLNFITLRIQDKKFGKYWLNKLVINSPKTYTPPDLSIFLTKENLLPFFIGLVDGDGSIWVSSKGVREWPNLAIELHGNWFGTLYLLSNKLKEFYNIECKVKLTKKGTSKLDINTKKDLRLLRNCIDNTEFLERKWNRLNDSVLMDIKLKKMQNETLLK